MAEPERHDEIIDQRGNVVPFHQPGNGHHNSNQSTHQHNTFGAQRYDQSPPDISALDALQDDIRRTQAHILWLEHFIATQLTTDSIWQNMAAATETERESTQIYGPKRATDGSGKLAQQLQINRKRQNTNKAITHRPHPAITTLQAERRHLHLITTSAIALGIKLDNIDFSRQQADMLIDAMLTFAQSAKLDPSDTNVQALITQALDTVLNRSAATSDNN